MRSILRVSFVLSTLCALLFAAAPPQANAMPMGVRGGFSTDPDQFLFGVHLQLDPLARNLYLVPSVEAGLGDDAFSLSINGDLQYRFRTRSDIKPYAGGGLSLYSLDPDGGSSNTDLGVNVLGGIFFNQRSGNPLFLEAKAGLTDEVPDWKFIFGVMFR